MTRNNFNTYKKGSMFGLVVLRICEYLNRRMDGRTNGQTRIQTEKKSYFV